MIKGVAEGVVVDVSPSLRRELLGVETLALRGHADDALARLAEVRVEAADQRMAVAEHAVLVERLGGHWENARDICDRTLDPVDEPAARGALLLSRARVSRGADRRRAYTSALAEFSLAGDARGKALALGWLAFPYEDDDGISLDYRARLGREGLGLAAGLADPYAIAVCAGGLAACETLLGEVSAYLLWHRSTDVPVAGLDTQTALVVSRNYVDWALTAVGRGEYALADRVAAEGAILARGRPYERLFAAVEALIALRRGDLAHAAEAAARAVGGDHAAEDHGAPAGGATDRAGAIGEIVRAGCALQQASRLQVGEAIPAVELIARESEQLGALGLSTLAGLRAARREPRPDRGLAAAIDRVRTRGRRFGWEDLVVAAAEIEPAGTGTLLAGLGELWPAGPRAEAVREYLEGLAAHDHRRLTLAADLFAALPEPLSAAKVRHTAAAAAPDAATRNRLLHQALELYRDCGADRGVAAILREGRLRRSPDLPTIPESQRNVVHAGLTPREHEVTALARQGLTAAEIAARLSIAEGTVRNHLLRARQKFGGIRKHRFAEVLGDD